jgi:CheY-like chemotaxis protein
MPKSLLLADDSVTIQKVVGISFANEDIEITTVDNGRDAVAKARAIRPDIILADVVMPGMSGYECARRSRPTRTSATCRCSCSRGRSRRSTRRARPRSAPRVTSRSRSRRRRSSIA